MHLLPATESDKVHPIFQDLDHHLAVRAILDGSVQSQIYVDDPDQPRAAFTWTQHRFFLAGMTGRNSFNASIGRLFTEVLYPQALATGQQMFQLYYAPAGWAPSIQDMLGGKHPIQRKRQYLVCRELRHNWRALLPGGFHLRFVDRALLTEPHLRNLDELTEEMRSERASVDDFLTHSFGVCLVHDAEIVGWCLSEYNSGQRCEVGIQTFPAYRRRGLATAMASALIEHALDTGLTEIGWHCWASNVPSIATARKVGFRKVKDYPVYFAWFDEALNLAINGNFCLQGQQYEEALTWFEESFARGVTQDWALWGAACASALLGRKQRALAYLSQAIDHGFTYLEHMLKSEHLKSLHGSAEWDALVKRLDAISTA